MTETVTASDVIRVAIVDDHFFFRQGVRDVLNVEPDIVVVAECEDGQGALEVLRSVHPDVVLMDVNLPNVNGLQITQRLKSACPDINVIILTAYDDEEQIYRAIRIGASAYFAKDVAPNQLLDTVRTVAYRADRGRGLLRHRQQTTNAGTSRTVASGAIPTLWHQPRGHHALPPHESPNGDSATHH